jgi:5-(carboxyamino)imidazole ribonucleotide synthase
MTERFLPGATIGLMGSGQLGRMFSIAARRMGYRVNVFRKIRPPVSSPTAKSRALMKMKRPCATSQKASIC